MSQNRKRKICRSCGKIPAPAGAPAAASSALRLRKRTRKTVRAAKTLPANLHKHMYSVAVPLHIPPPLRGPTPRLDKLESTSQHPQAPMRPGPQQPLPSSLLPHLPTRPTGPTHTGATACCCGAALRGAAPAAPPPARWGQGAGSCGRGGPGLPPCWPWSPRLD